MRVGARLRAAERGEGDGFGPESFALGRFRSALRAGMPREVPRETDFAAGGPRGDGFGPESVSLGRPRGSRVLGVPRDASREKPHVTGGGKGERGAPVSRQRPLLRKVSRQPARLHVALGRFRGALRAGMPPQASRETDFAAGGAEGDGFGPESVALGRSRGTRRALS